MFKCIAKPSSVKVASAISGGVDSAVSTLLLKQKGFNIIGVFMKNWIEDESEFCDASSDRDDAKLICDRLNIEFKEISFFKNYWNDVFCDLIAGYLNGQTPNPDILCNKHIKFGAFIKHATEHLQVDAVATGHYAGSSFGPFWGDYISGKSVKLLRPLDTRKDQTLFLSQISQQALRTAIFPLQFLTKAQVKDIAIKNGFEKIALKEESTGICFIGKRNFKSFIENYVEPKPGKFIDIDTDKVVGNHKGIHYWTVGERCRISGQAKAYFVVKKIPNSTDILVGSGTDHPALFSQSMTTSQIHWIGDQPIQLKHGQPLYCEFRFQHKEQPEPCKVTLSHNKLHIELSAPKRALTEGQFATLYKNNECLGSSVIQQVGPSLLESRRLKLLA